MLRKLIFAVVVLMLVVFVFSSLSTKTTLNEVNFCGEKYLAEKVLIDDVDVVSKVAEIVTKNYTQDGQSLLDSDVRKFSYNVCLYLQNEKNNFVKENNIPVLKVFKKETPVNDSKLFKNETYAINIKSQGITYGDANSLYIAFDTVSGDIYEFGLSTYDLNMFANGPFGKYK